VSRQMIRKEDLLWDEGDRSFELNDLRFVTVHGGGGFDDWVPGANCLLFFKTRFLVEQYLDYFASLTDPPRGGNLLELGLYDGGSVPFWFEILEPDHHSGVDINASKTPKYLDRYLAREDRRSQISMHWGVDQTDAKRLSEICANDFGDEPLDIVIDDASHLYEQSRRSFELLFPRVRPGGFYVIEDWAWSHWRGIEKEWRDRRPLTHLVHEIVELAGSTSNHCVIGVYACSGFAVVRRGWASAEELAGFSLDKFIYRHPR
jgi:hypothetical protein